MSPTEDTAEAEKFARYMRVINILLSIFMGLAAVLTLLTLSSMQGIFMAVYTVFFSFMLFIFELRLGSLESGIRDNFGFLFSFWGRTFFLCFMGTLCCALDTIIGYIAGTLMFANTLFNGYVIYKHPSFGKGDTTEHYTTAEEGAANWARNNPQTAMNMAGAVATVPGQRRQT